jgi:sulfate adenylyltransferase subunit 1 (EFTu-like GTPase family)
MSWFDGPPLLQYLEELPSDDGGAVFGPVRFPIQYVIRPDQKFRGFAGQIESGTLHPGDEVIVLPSGIRTRVNSIVTFDGELEEARAGDAVTLTLQDEVDLSRGDLLVTSDSVPTISQTIDSTLVWMHAEPLDARRLYLLKHTTRTVRAHVRAIRHRVDVNTLEEVSASTLKMNDIARVELQTTLPLIFDPYRQIAATGCFILIDPISNATVAAGMIEHAVDNHSSPALIHRGRTVSAHERVERFGHTSAAVWVENDHELAESTERLLFDSGADVHLVQAALFDDVELLAVARVFRSAGPIVIFSANEGRSSVGDQVRAIFGEANFFFADSDAHSITAQLRNRLYQPGHARGQA